jgi:hypothetical protein
MVGGRKCSLRSSVRARRLRPRFEHFKTGHVRTDRRCIRGGQPSSTAKRLHGCERAGCRRLERTLCSMPLYDRSVSKLGMWLASSSAGGVMGRSERRNVRERGALVQRLIKGVLQNPSLTLSVETLQAWLNVPVDAAQRILANLVSAGLLREVGTGVWVPGPLPGAQRVSY